MRNEPVTCQSPHAAIVPGSTPVRSDGLAISSSTGFTRGSKSFGPTLTWIVDYLTPEHCKIKKKNQIGTRQYEESNQSAHQKSDCARSSMRWTRPKRKSIEYVHTIGRGVAVAVASLPSRDFHNSMVLNEFVSRARAVTVVPGWARRAHAPELHTTQIN
ncbi:hypothetical protein EVAR_67918_1 [Eumeta japonica]|uniref:Uncharacterized protein n=1 Tax=Eumeta variegata TaxID=151549 RepID=A0A4C2AEW5_EUMVA|nr:hypothetical protein EVAR_67918_1 [Eumeta japonica]